MSWEDYRAEKYDELDWVNNKCELDELVDMCSPSPNDIVVDFGTGTGVVARAIAPYCKKVIAVDGSEKMLDIAKSKKNLTNIEYQHSNWNIRNISRDAHGFVARMSLHHVPIIELVLWETFFKWAVICEGIPPEGCSGWYEEMFKMKEERKVISIDNLVDLLKECGYESNIKIKVRSFRASINNWLQSSGLSGDTIRKIFQFHVDAPQYVKDAYDMEFKDNDIFMTWRTAIVRGEK